MPPSLLLGLPYELRLMIYAYLFDAGEPDPLTTMRDRDGDEGAGCKKGSARTISLRHSEPPSQQLAACTQCFGMPPQPSPPSSPSSSNSGSTNTPLPQPSRTRYHVMDHSWHRRCVETTYRLANKDAFFCAELMRVCRDLYEETAEFVYARHVFDFGADVEAVRPFFEDLSDATRRRVASVALYKKGPWRYDCWSDRCEWRAACTYLRENASVQHLRLVVQAGQVVKGQEVEADAPRELSSADVALLVSIRHEALLWIGDVVRLKGLRTVDVVPDFGLMPSPQTSNLLVFLAFSASLNTGVKDFLRERLQLTG
ncbi:hypothetical protein ANO14919_113440 [Xylariales sp. No.14919]|nr:hypothetical protein ANO14919_113440 [Xylariales sp. No.14919]